MIAAAAGGELLAALAALLDGGVEAAGEAPPGHPFFGAGFLFIGSLLVVEMLAGPIWRRSRLRTMLWPAALIVSGLGMLVVTFVQPDDKALHLILAILLIAGGVFEGRYRLGQIPRSLADAFAIPALIVGGFVIGPLHANGPLLQSTAAQTHLLVGMTGFLLAAIRLAQVLRGRTAALESTFGFGVMMMGMSLLILQQLHAGH